MKLIINILALFLLASTVVTGQSTCGTPQDDAFMKRLLKNKARWHETISKGSGSRLVPVTFHLVADNDGDGRLSEDLAYKAICTLNDRYEDLGVDINLYIKQFKVWNNSLIYNNTRTSPMPALKDATSLNIFCVGDIDLNGDGGITLGYYSPRFDLVVALNNQLGNEGWTLEHEIGHFFSLGHTHRGWEADPWNPEDFDEKITALTVTSSQVGEPAVVELVNRSNCESAGDFLCDTQADYGRGQSCNCCVLANVIMDRNCDTLRPMMNNIMSYSARCADWQFTGDQILAMRTDYDSPERILLRNSGVTAYTPVTESVQPTYPIALEDVEVYDYVEFTWNPVANAELYKIYIGEEEYLTTETSLVVTDLAPNSFVSWRVNALSKWGAGCVEVIPQAFRTGSSQFSATTDLGFVEGVRIYPNPLGFNQNLKIDISSSESFNSSINIYDVSGKIVFTVSGVNFRKGQDTYQINKLDLSEGLHILEIVTSEGSITEKIIVE